ncbi:Armadillo-type fold [Pseudocohnilembus persalinus]|uniref:Armadillo-type fold n=1 Tax=Pseudocohnilembus persalinus TaxID=266149 RepID=A0A0V0QS45_PSEPJ|nr:Armadillo-type fold [Pseudocohnilembus persalinus]|eukprot:KRX05150.1 Armadillo-type fold [Pseudocohnilembus persalinus]
MKIDFLWALYYISLNQIKTNLNIDNQESVDCFLKNDVLQIIKFSLNYDDQRIQEGALNLLGNLLLGKQQQNKIVFEKLIELGVMAKLIQFLNGINRQFRILCLRIVNNMVQIEGVTQSVYLQNIFPVLIQRISQDDSSVKIF